MRLLKGKEVADKILKNLKEAIKKEKVKPCLAVILVGEDSASKIYVELKKKAAKAIGIDFYLHKFKKLTKTSEIVDKIKELNVNEKIHGIIVQLPLPKKTNTQKIINTIFLEKDADGFSAKSEAVFGGQARPVFPAAIIKLLESSGASLRNKKAIVIANSKIFGETMLVALKQEKIRGKYILYKNHEKNLLAIKKADLVITAVGKPNFLKGDMVKKGAIIVDGGITKIGKKVLGDVDFESVKNKASCVSPVPGGVGPVTIACLLENVYFLNKKSQR
jgi:methylenetetrahydrofolate dehydrogenase (NADP+)/methenyltetrahydrofolate cyclohydrolase